MLTLQGQPFVFANRGAVYGNPADEEAFCKDLAESGDTKIRCALCMWNDFTLDVPSCRLRELLLGLNPENRETQFLLNGAEGCSVRSLKAMAPGPGNSREKQTVCRENADVK